MMKNLQLLAVLLLIQFQPTPAPVPRCSPFIIINKLAEFSNVLSDSNPYFPVPPCEYGGPLDAIAAGDGHAVFVLAEPEKIPRHNFYEFIWLLKTGLSRIGRMITGKEEFVADVDILTEGFSHSTPYVRTRAIGVGRKRQPYIIDNKDLYSHKVGNMIRGLIRNGKDKYTKFEGPYAYKNHGYGHGHGQGHGHGHGKAGHDGQHGSYHAPQPSYQQPSGGYQPPKKRQATLNIHNHEYGHPNSKTVQLEGGFQPNNGVASINRRTDIPSPKRKSMFEKFFK